MLASSLKNVYSFLFLGTSTALRMCYRGYGYPLMLLLEEGGVVTVCKINTQEPDELLDFDFCSTKVVNKIILQSEGLREAFAELDMTSEVLQITMSPDKPYFRYWKLCFQLKCSYLASVSKDWKFSG